MPALITGLTFKFSKMKHTVNRIDPRNMFCLHMPEVIQTLHELKKNNQMPALITGLTIKFS